MHLVDKEGMEESQFLSLLRTRSLALVHNATKGSDKIQLRDTGCSDVELGERARGDVASSIPALCCGLWWEHICKLRIHGRALVSRCCCKVLLWWERKEQEEEQGKDEGGGC